MINLLVCCGNGVGSSLLMKLKTESVLERYGVNAKISHASLGEAESIGKNFSVILCPKVFDEKLNKFSDNSIIIGIKNVLSEEEIETALVSNGIIGTE